MPNSPKAAYCASAAAQQFQADRSARHSILPRRIGIHPILSMAWRLHALGSSFELHYCTRTLARTAFKDLLKSAPFADRISLHLDDGPREQQFDIDACLAKPDADTHLYACGPGGFMEHVTSGRRASVGRRSRTHRVFSADVDVTGDVFTVRAARSGLTLTIPANQSIADVLLANNIELPLSCEQGVCGTCVTPVLEGVPDHRDFYFTDEERAANDQMTPLLLRARKRRSSSSISDGASHRGHVTKIQPRVLSAVPYR